MATATETRRYFTVLDEAGNAAPAVEYWSATVDEDVQPVYEVLPLRRFFKLLDSGERLEEAQPGVFISRSSGRTFFPMPAGQDQEAAASPEGTLPGLSNGRHTKLTP